ncbi:MAG: hypothetical protein KJ593_04885 [Candidatus Omnitrophica bacterium]|nr:hypothetical protein [Candidatus Omnitrophota bacterium]
MRQIKLEEIFHPIFNKISNIGIAAALNKKILEEDTTKLSSKELEAKFSHIIDVLGSIEENCNALHDYMKAIYERLDKETNFQTPKSPK